MELDVTEEMKDLLKVYTESQVNLEAREKYMLNNMVMEMKRFVEMYEKKTEVENKLYRLKQKIEEANDEECNECS
jgi:hypothetical protein